MKHKINVNIHVCMVNFRKLWMGSGYIYWWGAVYMCMVSKCLHNKYLILSEKSNKWECLVENFIHESLAWETGQLLLTSSTIDKLHSFIHSFIPSFIHSFKIGIPGPWTTFVDPVYGPFFHESTQWTTLNFWRRIQKVKGSFIGFNPNKWLGL